MIAKIMVGNISANQELELVETSLNNVKIIFKSGLRVLGWRSHFNMKTIQHVVAELAVRKISTKLAWMYG